MGEPLLWVSLRAVTLETGHIPCGSLEATMELLKKKDSVLWDTGLLSHEGPTPTFADLFLAPNSVFSGLCPSE